jgi:hypothetical protein
MQNTVPARHLSILEFGKAQITGNLVHGDCAMTHRTVIAAAVFLLATQAFLLATQASARVPAPMIPTALVEDVKGATAEVEFMDYVGSGQVIKLAPGDVVVLSYLKSCEHETITGGIVTVGAERSDVQGGRIVRAKVPCDGGKMRLSAEQASASAASAFRLQSADIQPRLYARTPVIQLPRTLAGEDRTLLIRRTDRRKIERHEIKLSDSIVAAGFYDLANSEVSLVRGAIYDARIGRHTMTFQVDAKAKSGPAPVVSRLLRFQ